MTFRPIIGMSPWTVCLSNCNGTLSKPPAWQARKSNTAMTSCENKKNRGASVVFRTHLLLGGKCYQSVGSVMNHVNVRHDHLETVRSEEFTQESKTTHRQRCNHIEQHRAYLRSFAFKTLRKTGEERVLRPDSQRPDVRAFPHLLETCQERKCSLDQKETEGRNADVSANILIARSGVGCRGCQAQESRHERD